MRKSLLLVLTLFGLFDSLYLWWVYTSPSRPLVCLGTGCDVVRASPYAQLAGRPLPLYGVAMYAALLLLILPQPMMFSSLARRLARLGVVVIAGAGFLFSIYLTGLEAFVIHAWCAWCVGSAITVTLIFLLGLQDAARPEPLLEPPVSLAILRRQFGILVVTALVGIAAFRYLSGREPGPQQTVSPQVLEERLVRPDSHATGDLSSPVTVVEFGDFECPACKLAQKTVEAVLAQYGNRIRFVFRQFPLNTIHMYAETAAEASECAADQGEFWQAADRFYQQQADLSEPALERYAAELGLDVNRFNQCLADHATVARVRRDVEDGKALGVRATPTFFVGDKKIEGPPQPEQLTALIDQQLSGHAPALARSAPPSIDGSSTSSPAEKKPSTSSTASPGAPSAGVAGSAGGSGDGGLGSSGGTALAQFGGSALACDPNETSQQASLIRTPEAEQLFTAKALFVDVRSAGDFAKEHIAGAINVPVEEIENRWSTLPKDRTIVLYESGRAGGSPDDVCAFSRDAGRVLLSHGFNSAQVKVYQDGLAGWEKSGSPVEK